MFLKFTYIFQQASLGLSCLGAFLTAQMSVRSIDTIYDGQLFFFKKNSLKVIYFRNAVQAHSSAAVNVDSLARALESINGIFSGWLGRECVQGTAFR